MGVLDKFLDAMKLNDDDDFDEDDYYDEDEYYDDQPKKPGFMKRGNKYEDDYDDEPAPKRASRQPEREEKAEKTEKHSSSSQRSSSKVTPMRSPRRQNGGGSMEVCVIRPTSVEDDNEICETLLSNRTVVLNLEGLDIEVAQRILDFSSGSCCALNGNLQKISKFIFLLTPSNVDISGDLTDILSDSFEAPSVNTNF